MSLPFYSLPEAFCCAMMTSFENIPSWAFTIHILISTISNTFLGLGMCKAMAELYHAGFRVAMLSNKLERTIGIEYLIAISQEGDIMKILPWAAFAM